MAKVIIHATVTLDGFMADRNGGMDWTTDVKVADEDMKLVGKVWEEIGAIVGGANKTQAIEEGEVLSG